MNGNSGQRWEERKVKKEEDTMKDECVNEQPNETDKHRRKTVTGTNPISGTEPKRGCGSGETWDVKKEPEEVCSNNCARMESTKIVSDTYSEVHTKRPQVVVKEEPEMSVQGRYDANLIRVKEEPMDVMDITKTVTDTSKVDQCRSITVKRESKMVREVNPKTFTKEEPKMNEQGVRQATVKKEPNEREGLKRRKEALEIQIGLFRSSEKLREQRIMMQHQREKEERGRRMEQLLMNCEADEVQARHVEKMAVERQQEMEKKEEERMMREKIIEEKEKKALEERKTKRKMESSNGKRIERRATIKAYSETFVNIKAIEIENAVDKMFGPALVRSSPVCGPKANYEITFMKRSHAECAKGKTLVVRGVVVTLDNHTR